MCDFPSKNGPMSIFFKALLAGLTNQRDISDSFAVTPLIATETYIALVARVAPLRAP